MEFQSEQGRFYLQGKDGTLLAEILFPEIEPGLVDIAHTFVDPSLRGQGIAAQLVHQVVVTLRQEKKKAKASCAYAQSYFASHPEERDVLAD